MLRVIFIICLVNINLVDNVFAISLRIATKKANDSNLKEDKPSGGPPRAKPEWLLKKEKAEKNTPRDSTASSSSSNEESESRNSGRSS